MQVAEQIALGCRHLFEMPVGLIGRGAAGY
jgi:hypothetical protein